MAGCAILTGYVLARAMADAKMHLVQMVAAGEFGIPYACRRGQGQRRFRRWPRSRLHLSGARYVQQVEPSWTSSLASSVPLCRSGA